jgi:phospholipase/lecithinase/hemolysin
MKRTRRTFSSVFKAKAILEPLLEKGITHGQLQQLWDMVNKAINKNMNQ